MSAVLLVVPAISCRVSSSLASQWRNGDHWHLIWPEGGHWCYPTQADAHTRAAEVAAIRDPSNVGHQHPDTGIVCVSGHECENPGSFTVPVRIQRDEVRQ